MPLRFLYWKIVKRHSIITWKLVPLQWDIKKQSDYETEQDSKSNQARTGNNYRQASSEEEIQTAPNDQGRTAWHTYSGVWLYFIIMEKGYPYRFVMNESSFEDYLIETSIYTFRSAKSNLVYLVRVEHYKMDIYIIKFYLKSNRNSPYKYNLLTNTFEPRRIINTCINILMDIYQKHPDASFGFIGANRIGESEANTKRYRIYKKIVTTYFTDIYFYHHYNTEKSAYILINKLKLKENPSLVGEIEQFFIDIYPSLEDWF